MKGAVFSIQDGIVRGLAGGPISIAELGSRTTERASRVEFNATLNTWEVTDAKSNKLLFSDPDYDKALAWEVDHYNEQLLVG